MNNKKGSISLEPFLTSMRFELLILIFLLSFQCLAQSLRDSVNYQLFREVIYTLADDSMRGRATGSYEEIQSLEYISKTFQSLTGFKLKKQDFTIQLDAVELNTANAYCFLNNHSKQTIVLSAHYDHIGMGGPLSKSRKNDEVHNGADDNASGVALLLGIARQLASHKRDRNNYLIVFYSGHEIGLYGSEAFSEFALKKQKFGEIHMVINFDMVGRMDPELKKLKCMRSVICDSVLSQVNPVGFGFELRVTEEEKLMQLDTKHFYSKGIPCMNFTTGIHNDYHATSDDANYISLEGMVRILDYLTTLLSRM